MGKDLDVVLAVWWSAGGGGSEGPRSKRVGGSEASTQNGQTSTKGPEINVMGATCEA
jgi:hypothetical protein